MKKYPPIVSSIGYLNINILYSKDGEPEWFSRLHTKYRKVVRKYKDIENDFYSNDSLNGDLESRF